MVASRVVCPRAVLQPKTKCLSVAAGARNIPRGAVAVQRRAVNMCEAWVARAAAAAQTSEVLRYVQTSCRAPRSGAAIARTYARWIGGVVVGGV
eukprot:4600227-Prymnesium_polylepis.1